MSSSWLLALLAPPRCAACGRSCEVKSVLCGGCTTALAATPPPPVANETAWAAFPHEGVARDLVVALKFRALLAVAGLIADQIAGRAPEGLLCGTLVPVPAAPARLRRRGFDPAEEIALRLAGLTGLPASACLQRADSAPQVGRSRRERIDRPPRVRAIGPAPVDALLVDDVVTTGATLSACARALRAGGASRVTALTFARTL